MHYLTKYSNSPCSSYLCRDESVCERVVLCKLDSLVKDYIDPLQFAYRRHRSTDNTVLYVLENTYSHLEHKHTYRERERERGNFVRLMFFDFFSAFDTIQPHFLVRKLFNMKLPSAFISSTLDYIRNRLQYLRLNGVQSSVICINTGALQCTVSAPFLCSLYRADCRSTDESCPLVKFADDPEQVRKSSNDEDALYHNHIENL